MAVEFGTFTPDAPAQTSSGEFSQHPVNPDIATQDSHSYAGAVATQKVQDLAAAAPSAPPTVEKMWEFYDKAYDDAEKFKQDLQRRVIELSPNPKTGMSLIQTEAAERAQIEQQKQQILQGPSATRQAQELAKPGQPIPYIERESKDYGDKISAVSTDFAGIDRLSQLHDQMTTNSIIGTGGFLKSAAGNTRKIAIDTSADARAYFGLADLLTPTFGKGIQGDLPTATTKANIIEMMDRNVIPNEIDNKQSAHNKWFNLYNQGYTVLSNLRSQMKTEGQDTSRVDGILADGQSWLKNHSDWDPVKNQAIVKPGISDQANQVINAAAGAPQQTQGTVWQGPPKLTPLPPPGQTAPSQPQLPGGGALAGVGAYNAPPAISQQPSPGLNVVKSLTDLPLHTLPGQIWNLLQLKPGGPSEDLTRPPEEGIGGWEDYGNR